jgi:quinoprotein dehydrogenase-associated probable ABC transporter substrate-binding protein
MYSLIRIAAFSLAFGCAPGIVSATALRVCADPNNLPYSNDQQQGFENKIADLIAKDLGAELTYFWFPQREAFFRKTLNAGVCDVVMGVPSSFDEAEATRPYYRSTYVFISRSDRHLNITSFGDPRLRTLKIGVHILGEQNDSLPPVHALINRGIVNNLVGFSIFGNLDESNPASDLIKAVSDGKVEVAIAWGPLAGYFSQHSAIPLSITPVADDFKDPNLPFRFDICIGVRRGNVALRERLDQEILRRRSEIAQILTAYGVPQITLPIETARSTEE